MTVYILRIDGLKKLSTKILDSHLLIKQSKTTKQCL